jgi:TP901 family phage tail tape measure protein
VASAFSDLTIRVAADASQAIRAFQQVRREAEQVGRAAAMQAAGMQKFQQSLATAGKSLQSAGQAMRNTGAAMTAGLTVPLAAAGFAAVRQSMQFEQSFALIQGLIGASETDVASYRDAVLSLSGSTGRAPNELAAALYFLTSSGLEGKAAIDALAESARAANAGLGVTQDIANLVSSGLNAYAKSGITATQIVDQLTAAVRVGKAEPSEFAHSLGMVLPIASEMGVTFAEASAAVASMTLTGNQTQTAVVQLRGVLASLLKPGKAAEDTLASLGLTSQGIRDQLRMEGLLPTLNRLKAAFEGNDEAVAKVFDDVRPLTAVLSLTGENSAKVAAAFDAVNKSSGDMGRAFDIISRSTTGRMNQALANLQAMLISIGDILAPVVVKISEFANAAAKGWARMDAGTKSAIVGIAGVVAVLGPALIALGALTLLGGSVMERMAKPDAWFRKLGFLLSPGGLVIGGVILLLEKLDLLQPVLTVFKDIGTAAVGAVAAAFKALKDIVVDVGDAIGKLTGGKDGIGADFMKGLIPGLEHGIRKEMDNGDKFGPLAKKMAEGMKKAAESAKVGGPGAGVGKPKLLGEFKPPPVEQAAWVKAGKDAAKAFNEGLRVEQAGRFSAEALSRIANQMDMLRVGGAVTRAMNKKVAPAAAAAAAMGKQGPVRPWDMDPARPFAPGIPKGGPGVPIGGAKGAGGPAGKGGGKGGGPQEPIEKGNPFGVNPAEGVGELIKLMKGVFDTLVKIEKKPGAEIEPANL